jgi:hypothetical protein
MENNHVLLEKLIKFCEENQLEVINFKTDMIFARVAYNITLAPKLEFTQ